MNIIHGDCLEELKKLEDNSIDAVVCDPPYGLSNTKPQQVSDVLKAWVTGDTVSVPAKRGGFMGKDWDSFVPPPAVWEECMRVLKPGGHMAVFAGARTQDLMGLSIRLAGFEIRDTLGWVYGSGMPKSLDISKAIDKYNGNPLAFREFAAAYREAVAKSGLTHSAIDNALGIKSSSCYWARDDHRGGMPPRHHWEKVRDLVHVSGELERLYDEAEREVVGVREVPQGHAFAGSTYGGDSSNKSVDITTPATSEAQRWDGWGTSLKPAIEPILLCRKPLDGTVANNVLAHGVGGLNIDACRVAGKPWKSHMATGLAETKYFTECEAKVIEKAPHVAGRFPANVLLDEHAAKEMDEQSGWSKSPDVGSVTNTKARHSGSMAGAFKHPKPMQNGHGDSGGASRFFPVFKYQAKAPKKERPVIEREDGSKIQHPTVKPVALMEWLVELITPPNGVVLDTFAGSGTTLQAALNKGFQPIGIEQDADYIKLIEKRLEATCTTRKN